MFTSTATKNPQALEEALSRAARGDLRALMQLDGVARASGMTTSALNALIQQRRIDLRPLQDLGVWTQRATWSKTGVATLWAIACEHGIPDDEIHAFARARGNQLVDFAAPGEWRTLTEVPPDVVQQLEKHVFVASGFQQAWQTVDRLAEKLHVPDDEVAEIAKRHGDKAVADWAAYSARRGYRGTRKPADPFLVQLSAADALALWRSGGAKALSGMPAQALDDLRSAVDVVAREGGSVGDVEDVLTGPPLPLAERVLTILRDAGTRGLRKSQIIDAFNRNVSAVRLNAALGELAKRGAVSVTRETTAGRPAERWRPLPAHDEEGQQTLSSFKNDAPEAPQPPVTAPSATIEEVPALKEVSTPSATSHHDESHAFFAGDDALTLDDMLLVLLARDWLAIKHDASRPIR